MPNQITASGLQIKTLTELISDLTTALQGIYGADINVDSDSPDGQLINILSQAAVDNLDLLAQINASFDPDQAIGRTLDERCALNGIQRLGGTYSFTDIEVTVDRALNLSGLDSNIESTDGTGYTISDSQGNQWILAYSQTIGAAGTYLYSFRSKLNGAARTTPNTITTPVTVVLGVTSVNNPSAQTVLGLDEETDSALKLRRQKSVALSSTGYADSLLANLLNINGVTSAFVYENVTGSTDSDGIPGHGIWVIVAGGTDEDVAKAIHAKRNAGCNMKGSSSYSVTRPNGQTMTIYFDRSATESLYIKLTANSLDGKTTIDPAYIRAQIVLLFIPGVFETVNTNQLATTVRSIDPNIFVSSSGFGLSLIGATNAIFSPTAKNYQFTLDATHIEVTVAHKFTVSTASATAGATYTNGGRIYTVTQTLSSGSTLHTTSASDGVPNATGTLTKTSGTGDSTIIFSSVVPE